MTTDHTGQPTWTNWAGNQSFAPKAIVEIKTDDEIAPLVAKAANQGIGVRTLGTGHSFTPIVETSGLLLDLGRLRGIVAIDPVRQQVTAWPKTTIGDFGEPLWDQGLALANQGDIDTQAIAGAIATATHGSGRHLPNFMEYFLPLENAHAILDQMRKLMWRWLPLSIYPLEQVALHDGRSAGATLPTL